MLLVLGLGGLAIGSWIVSYGSQDGDFMASDAAEATDRRLVGSGAPTSDRCDLSPGTTLSFDVVSGSEAHFDLSPLMGDIDGGTQLSVEAPAAVEEQASRRWYLDLEVVQHADDGSMIAAARIDDEGTRGSQGASPPDPALAEPFLLRLDRRCGIKEFGWQTEGNLEIAREQQMLTSALGFWTAPRGRSDGETFGEAGFNASGRYQAVYQDDGKTVTGRIIHFNNLFARAFGPEAPRVEVNDSSMTVATAPGQWFETLDATHKTTVVLADQEIGTQQSTVQAKRTNPPSIAFEVDPDDGSWTFGLLLGRPLPGDQQSEIDEALVGISVDDAADRLLALIEAGVQPSQYAAFLRDWLRANPDGADRLVDRLLAGAFDADGVATSTVFYALGAAGTDQSRDALLDLVGDQSPRAYQIAAGQALAMAPNPTDEMVGALAELAGRDGHRAERASASMAMGIFAAEQADRAPEIAAAAREEIRDWLDHPATDEDIAGSLLAAGNAGHDDLVPAIEPYLDAEDPDTRTRATHALRKMSPDEAYPRLETRMLDDDANVRRTAARTAAEVALARGELPPEAMLQSAIDGLDAASSRGERDDLTRLLGAAAKAGSQLAADSLQDRIYAELESPDRNVAQLRALGRSSGAHWLAED